MLVRGAGLAETMSRYLIDRIAAAPNIELLARHRGRGAVGNAGGSALPRALAQRQTGEEQDKPIRNLFLFIGADPATAWLAGCGVAMDAKGFVRTGAAVAHGELRRGWLKSPAALESNVLGVFAVGDVRSGSVKRVGAAIGEGAEVVAQCIRCSPIRALRG